MAATISVKQRNSSVWKKLFPVIKQSNPKIKMFFWNNYIGLQPFLINCYFTKTFLHLSEIAAVCYFSIDKMMGWNPINIYLFKDNSRNARKGSEICLKLIINKVWSHSVTLNIFHSFLVFLFLTWNRLMFDGEIFLLWILLFKV